MITKPTTYTEEFVKKEVNDLLEDAISRTDVVFIGELLDAKPYSRQRISEWANDFKGEISDIIEKIKEILEQRLVKGAVINKFSPVMSKFVLINHHKNWKEKIETDVTSGGEKISGFNYVKPDANHNTNG